MTLLMYGPREPGEVCYYPRSGKVYFIGLGLITRRRRAARLLGRRGLTARAVLEGIALAKAVKVTRSWLCHACFRASSRVPSRSRSRSRTQQPADVAESTRLRAVPAPIPRARPHPGAQSEGALMASVIALANQKGGVAKTTTTLNLGVALARAGEPRPHHRPRPAGQPHDEPGHEPRRDRALDVRRARPPGPDLGRHPAPSRSTSRSPRSTSPAPSSRSSALIGRERALDKALVEVRDRYDYILIDTPPSLGLLTINAFVAADGVIVPVQCEYLSLRGLVQLENTLAMVRENLNPRVHVQGIVPTMYDGRTLHAREAIEILEEHFGDLIYETRIRKTVRYAEAPVKGSPSSSTTRPARPRRPTAISRRRCSMARKRATMREGPLAELFRKTEAAQRAQARRAPRARPPAVDPGAEAALDETVEHVPDFAKEPESGASQPRRVRPRSVAAPDGRSVRTRLAASRAAARYFQTMLEPAPQLHRVPPPKGAAYIAAIRVVGVGGAGLERDPPDDGRRDRAGRLRRRQHRPPGSSRSRTRRRRSRSARGSRRASARAPTRTSGARAAEEAIDQLKAALRGVGHGLRHRGRGRRHRHRRRTGRRAHRARARRAHGRDRHHAVPVRGNAPASRRPRPASTSCAPPATPSSSSPTTACSRCSTARRRWSTRSRSPTTSCARACRGSAT